MKLQISTKEELKLVKNLDYCLVLAIMQTNLK